MSGKSKSNSKSDQPTKKQKIENHSDSDSNSDCEVDQNEDQIDTIEANKIPNSHSLLFLTSTEDGNMVAFGFDQKSTNARNVSIILGLLKTANSVKGDFRIMWNVMHLLMELTKKDDEDRNKNDFGLVKDIRSEKDKNKKSNKLENYMSKYYGLNQDEMGKKDYKVAFRVFKGLIGLDNVGSWVRADDFRLHYSLDRLENVVSEYHVAAVFRSWG